MLKPEWKRDYKKALGLTLIVAAMFSGCRFGNYEDPTTQNVQGTITKSELFFTEAKTFQTFVYYDDNTHTSNTTSPLVSIPSSLLETFTSPVYLNTYHENSDTQFFWDENESVNPYLTATDASGHVSATSTSAAAQFYHNTNCQTQVQTIQSGSLDRTAPGTATLPGAHNTSKIAGHLNLDITALQVIEGDCADDLRELANCYQNGAGCDADQLTRAKMFDLFVRGTGVLNIQDAPKIIGLAYIVHFE